MPDRIHLDDSVSALSVAEDRTNTLWTAHDKTHTLEHTAVQTAIDATGSQQHLIKEYLKAYLDAELRLLRTMIESLRHKHDADLAALALLRETAKVATDIASESWRVAHQREHTLAQLAIDKAEASLAIRLAGLNEARERSTDERSTYATRTQLDDKLEAVTARLNILERGVSTVAGRDHGISVALALGVSAVSFIIGIASLIVHFLK